ncbi:MAG: PAS domain-containing protein [Deltaproteobacteria bacterium]|nr:PAS domain-containing protein [Deltaproteobacteria bacterium]
MGVADSEFGARILDSMSSGVVAIDGDHRIVILNDGARRILGCPCGEDSSSIGEPCTKLLASQPAVAQLLVEALDAHSPLSRAELVLESFGERDKRTIGFTLSPVRDEHSRVCGAAMIFRDLTPFERMDEQDRLRERLTALGQMAADLAHEIRNPLAGMEVVAGLLKRRLKGRPDEERLVDQVIGELRSLADTVTASLEFVAPPVLERECVDPVALVEESIAIARSRVSFDGTIHLDFESGLSPIDADAEQLRSVITNLVVNAFESMADTRNEPRLDVSMCRLVNNQSLRSVRVESDGRMPNSSMPPSQELELTIRDTGPGVSEDLREKIFYPFFTTKQQGSGIGLAAAQKIVTSHGGIIELDDGSDVGATFRVRIPLSDAAADDSVSRRREHPTASTVAGSAR